MVEGWIYPRKESNAIFGALLYEDKGPVFRGTKTDESFGRTFFLIEASS